MAIRTATRDTCCLTTKKKRKIPTSLLAFMLKMAVRTLAPFIVGHGPLPFSLCKRLYWRPSPLSISVRSCRFNYALRFYRLPAAKTEVRFCILMMAKSGYGLPAIVCPTSRDYYYYFTRYQHYSAMRLNSAPGQWIQMHRRSCGRLQPFLQLRAQTCAILHQLKPRNLKSSRTANFVPR